MKVKRKGGRIRVDVVIGIIPLSDRSMVILLSVHIDRSNDLNCNSPNRFFGSIYPAF